ETTLPAVDDATELGNNRFKRAVADRIDTYRLTKHPVSVKTQSGFDRSPAIRAVSLNYDEIAGWLRPNGTWLSRVAVEQLDQRLCRHKFQRDHAYSVSGRRITRPIGHTCGNGFSIWCEAVTLRILHERYPAHTQRIFQHEKQVLSGDRAAGRQA